MADEMRYTDEERYEIIEDIENILVLHGIMPGSEDFDEWSDDDLDAFEIEEYLLYQQ